MDGAGMSGAIIIGFVLGFASNAGILVLRDWLERRQTLRQEDHEDFIHNGIDKCCAWASTVIMHLKVPRLGASACDEDIAAAIDRLRPLLGDEISDQWSEALRVASGLAVDRGEHGPATPEQRRVLEKLPKLSGALRWFRDELVPNPRPGRRKLRILREKAAVQSGLREPTR